MAGRKKVLKGALPKDDWMRLHGRPAGPMARQTQVDELEDLEEEDFEASEEPFFFEENKETD